MKELLTSLKKSPVVYVTRDLERALGLSLSTPGYFIVANYSTFGKRVANGKKNVLLIKSNRKLDTRELLAKPAVVKLINKLNAKILVFKNTTQIEKICSEQGWTLLNPSAALASKVEEKISQLKWLGPLQKYLPPHKVMFGKELLTLCHSESPFAGGEESLSQRRDGQRSLGGVNPARDDSFHKFILQFNRAHTGSGTILVESEKQLAEIAKQFPNREVRVTKFIKGPAYTVNACVWNKKVLIGNPSYQITGLAPFTNSPFATIGNDWALACKALSAKQVSTMRRIAVDVGQRLAKDGWKGLFGVDFIVGNQKSKIKNLKSKVYLIEINARQPASTTYESQLQKSKKAKKQKSKLTTFEAHLASLLGLLPTPYSLLPFSDGAQIIQRVKEKGTINKEQAAKRLTTAGFNVIEYDNKKPGEDLLRIQSTKGIMAKHNEFNETGERIRRILKDR